MEVIVFPNTSAQPTSNLELVTRVVAALNAAIRADAAAAGKMQGVAIEGAPFVEGPNVFIRLRTAAPGPARLSKRLADARVNLGDPGSGNPNTKLLTVYGLTEVATNPSRYQLGASYASASALPDDRLYPKERALVDLVRRDRSRGRRVLVYATHTGIRDITPRLRAVERLAARAGIQAAPLLLPLLNDSEVGVRLYAARRPRLLPRQPRGIHQAQHVHAQRRLDPVAPRRRLPLEGGGRRAIT